MPVVPEGAKKPSDRKPSTTAAQREQRQEENAVLKGMPKLLPPTELRLRQRNEVTLLLARLSQLADEDGTINIDTADMASPRVKALLDLLAEADEFAESIAEDPEAYRKWAVAKSTSYQQFATIITRYGRAVGESISSSN